MVHGTLITISSCCADGRKAYQCQIFPLPTPLSRFKFRASPLETYLRKWEEI